MKSLNIQISEKEFNQLGLKRTSLSFSELMALIEKRITLRALERSVALAEKYGFSEMSMDEIDVEVKAQENAQDNS